MGAKTKSKRQVAYLLSKGNPLTGVQKSKLRNELHSHAVRVVGSRKARKRSK